MIHALAAALVLLTSTTNTAAPSTASDSFFNVVRTTPTKGCMTVSFEATLTGARIDGAYLLGSYDVAIRNEGAKDVVVVVGGLPDDTSRQISVAAGATAATSIKDFPVPTLAWERGSLDSSWTFLTSAHFDGQSRLPGCVEEPVWPQRSGDEGNWLVALALPHLGPLFTPGDVLGRSEVTPGAAFVINPLEGMRAGSGEIDPESLAVRDDGGLDVVVLDGEITVTAPTAPGLTAATFVVCTTESHCQTFRWEIDVTAPATTTTPTSPTTAVPDLGDDPGAAPSTLWVSVVIWAAPVVLLIGLLLVLFRRRRKDGGAEASDDTPMTGPR